MQPDAPEEAQLLADGFVLAAYQDQHSNRITEKWALRMTHGDLLKQVYRAPFAG